uniref:Juvenile hormone acid methyltransferase n=1 Tax=Rhipicephalus appendiculatus TaxID=34631 RepID=A0A131YRK1_RHIAP
MTSLNTEEGKLQAGPFQSTLAPEIYEERNVPANHEPKGIIQIFKMAFTIPSDESQQYLDIGCGTGDFTREWILPSCDPCKRIVAVDFSASMLEYAKEKYAHEKIVYEHLDIDGDVTGLLRKYGTFQRVYSFKTLHWSRDLHHSLGNIAQLLAPGGECLLLFHSRSFLLESFKEICRLEPWSKYADVILQAVPKSQDIVDQKGQRDYISSALSSAGLVPYTTELLTRTVPPQIPTGAFQKLAQIANPVFSLLSEEEKTAFLETLSTHLPEWYDSYCKRGGPILWSSFLVHARKT